MKRAFFMFAIIQLILACGSAKSSDRAKASRVFTDQAGYVCFIIRDEDGKAIGGNCLRE